VQNRRIVEYIRAGVIGDVKEVYTWTNRPVWPQGDLKREAATMPAGMNWDAWIGPAPMRDYHKNLHPFGWRGWFEFGCGAVGDMGCHTWDNVFWAMQPDYPSQVELLEIEGKGAETFPSKSHFKWTFPAKGNRPGFVGHWYSGGMKPNALLEEHYKAGRFTENGKPAGYTNSGSIYVGSKGQLVTFGDYGSAPQVFPEELGKDLKVEASIPRSPGHYDEWVMAIKGEKPWNFPGSNFADYAAPITEVMLVGAIAEKIGEVGLKIDCDAEKREIITPRAAAYRGREYRKGWELPKL
jgi:predicted dehydrogenase